MRTTAVDMGVDFSRGEDRKKNPHGSAKEKRRRKSLFLGYARIFSECFSVMGRKINFLSIFLFNFMCAAVAEGLDGMLQPRVEVKKACENFSKNSHNKKLREKLFPSSIFFYFARIAAVACLLVTNIYSTFRWMGKLEIETRTTFYVCIEQLHAITSTDTSDWVSFFRNFPPKNRRLSQQQSSTQEKNKTDHSIPRNSSSSAVLRLIAHSTSWIIQAVKSVREEDSIGWKICVCKKKPSERSTSSQ